MTASAAHRLRTHPTMNAGPMNACDARHFSGATQFLDDAASWFHIAKVAIVAISCKQKVAIRATDVDREDRY